MNNLPFIVAFFSLNVPAGLGVYWITNNILTTIVTVAVKATIKDEPMPAEVDQMMAMLDAPEGETLAVSYCNPALLQPYSIVILFYDNPTILILHYPCFTESYPVLQVGGVTKIRSSPSSRQMMKSSIVDDSKRVEGFGSTLKAIDVEGSVVGEKDNADADDEDDDDDDDDDDDETLEKGDADKTDESSNRKRRTKPSKKGGKK